MLNFKFKILIYTLISLSQLFPGIPENLSKYYNDILNILEKGNGDIYNIDYVVDYLYDNNLNEEYYEKLDNYNLILNVALNSPDFFLKVDKEYVEEYKIHSKYFIKVKKRLNKKEKAKIVNSFLIENKEEKSTDLAGPTFSKYFDGSLIFSLNIGQVYSQPLFGNVNTFYTNGKSLNFIIYHPDPIEIFSFISLLAFGINKYEFKSGWHKNYSLSSFNLHLINYIKRFPLRIDLSLGLANNIKYEGGFLFKTALNYEIEFNPINLLLALSYNKFIDIDDNQLNFKALDFILLNIQLSKEFKIN